MEELLCVRVLQFGKNRITKKGDRFKRLYCFTLYNCLFLLPSYMHTDFQPQNGSRPEITLPERTGRPGVFLLVGNAQVQTPQSL